MLDVTSLGNFVTAYNVFLQRFFLGSIISISSTLSCSKLCILFVVVLLTPFQRPHQMGLNIVLKRVHHDVHILYFYPHSVSHNTNSKAGSSACLKGMESLELNTTKLLSNLVRMSSLLLPH